MKYHKLLQTLVEQKDCIDPGYYSELLESLLNLIEESADKDDYLVVHLMNDSIYNQKLINRIKENSIDSNCKHIYLLPNSNLKYIKPEENLILYGDPKDLEKYLVLADIILVQYLFQFYIDPLLDERVHSDIFWMPWAGDYIEYSDMEIIDQKEIEMMDKRGVVLNVNYRRHPRFQQLLDRLSLIICGTAVYKFIKDIFPQTTLKHMNHYFHQDVIEIEDEYIEPTEIKLLENYANSIDNSLIKIILGNSGSLTNNYLTAIDFLAQSPIAERLHITVMNSYGAAPNYDILIKDQLDYSFPNRYVIFEDFLSSNAFIKFSSYHDAVFMFHNRPQGLGAISIYLALGMPVYMWPHNLCFGYLESLRASVQGLHRLTTPDQLTEIPTKDKASGALNVSLLREEIQYSDARLISLIT